MKNVWSHPDARAFCGARFTLIASVLCALGTLACDRVGTGPGEGGGQTTSTAPEIRRCYDKCSVPADCAETDEPSLGDEKHFACKDGGCRRLGCMTDAECVAHYGSGWACGLAPGDEMKGCHQPCSSVADCSSPDAPAVFDESHYSCTQTFCVYLGCKTHSECSAYYSSWGCGIAPGESVARCHPACSTAADCATPGGSTYNDEDHYACEDGICIHLGCQNDAECESFYGPEHVCR